MVVQRVYFGSKVVKRVYLNGEVIWKLGGGELSIDHVLQIMPSGFHMVSTGDSLSLFSNEVSSSTINGRVCICNAPVLNADCKSQTEIAGCCEPFAAVSIICDAHSVSHIEADILVAKASMLSLTEDISANTEASALVAESVYIAHCENVNTTMDASILIPDPIISSFEEFIPVSDEKYIDAVDYTPLAFYENDCSEYESSMLVVESSEVVDFFTNLDSQQNSDAHLHPLGIAELASLYHIVTTCDAHLAVAAATGIDIDSKSATTTLANMQFQDGDAENENFTDLYIELTIADEEGNVFIEVDGVDYPLENVTDPVETGIEDTYIMEIIS